MGKGTCLVKGHAILDEKTDAGIKEADVTFENKIALRLGGYARLEFPETLLGWFPRKD